MNDNEKSAVETAKKIAETAYAALDNKKAVEPTVLEVGKQTVLADYFVLATGTSGTHIKALADETEFKLREELGIEPSHVEGFGDSAWILLDYGCVIIHVFTKEARDFYKLEKLWDDTTVVNK